MLLTAAAMPLSFLSVTMAASVYLFMGLVWLIMFANGFIEPILTGILLNSVEVSQRPTASSLLIFLQMILGYLPAPYVYGLLMELIPDIED